MVTPNVLCTYEKITILSKKNFRWRREKVFGHQNGWVSFVCLIPLEQRSNRLSFEFADTYLIQGFWWQKVSQVFASTNAGRHSRKISNKQQKYYSKILTSFWRTRSCSVFKSPKRVKLVDSENFFCSNLWNPN